MLIQEEKSGGHEKHKDSSSTDLENPQQISWKSCYMFLKYLVMDQSVSKEDSWSDRGTRQKVKGSPKSLLITVRGLSTSPPDLTAI